MKNSNVENLISRDTQKTIRKKKTDEDDVERTRNERISKTEEIKTIERNSTSDRALFYCTKIVLPETYFNFSKQN